LLSRSAAPSLQIVPALSVLNPPYRVNNAIP
jgi:hypothetical protein